MAMRGGARRLMRAAGPYALLVVAGASGACARAATVRGPEVETRPESIEAGVAAAPGEYATGFDALRYQTRIVIPDTGTFLGGSTRITLAASAAAPDTLSLDLAGMQAPIVRVNGKGVAARSDAGKLRVPLPAESRRAHAAQSGAGAGAVDTLVVDVVWAGRPGDGLSIGRNVHGERTVFADNWPNRARFWFPSLDHPSDKAAVEFKILPPSGWQVIANGVQVRRDSAAIHYGTDRPIPTYTMVIGVARMAVTPIGYACRENGTWRVRPPLAADLAAPEAFGAAATGSAGGARATPDGCIPVSSWIFPQDTAPARRIFRRAPEIVAWLSNYVGDFPYEKLAHVQSSTRFGGMENASAIFYDEKAIAGGTLSEETVAHETAHQWFGDAVTETEWSDLWLSEGFATYFAGLWVEGAHGPDAFREYMDAQRREYIASTVTDRPVVDTAQRNLFALLNANSYNKGAWVLHMLRGLVGDTAFRRGIRAYFAAHVHANATTADFRDAMEAASGRDLGWFFEQWLERGGYPVIRARIVAGNRIELSQVQTGEAFRVPVVVEMEMADGGRVRRAVEMTSRVVEVSGVSGRVVGVRVDPDGWVLGDFTGSGTGT